MGVNLFAGKMSSCKYKETGEKIWHPEDFKKFVLHFQSLIVEFSSSSKYFCIICLDKNKNQNTQSFYNTLIIIFRYNLTAKYQIPDVPVYNESDCKTLTNLTNGLVHWTNLEVNFDNVPIAYVALLQVKSFCVKQFNMTLFYDFNCI